MTWNVGPLQPGVAVWEEEASPGGCVLYHTSWIDRFYSKLHETKMAELNKDKATEYISPGIKSNIQFNF